MVDLDDQELEFDRLRAGVDVQAAVAFGQNRSTLFGHPPDKLAHLAAVAELAARHAEAYYIDRDQLERRYLVRVCEAAGALHETLLQGCSFEDLVTVTDEAVSRVVADVTPDLRAPAPVRMRQYANQLGLSSSAAQLVKLADLRHDCLRCERLVATDPLAVRIWLDEAGPAAGSLRRLHDTPLARRLSELNNAIRCLDRATQAFRRRGGTR